MFITQPGRISPHVHFAGNRMICNYIIAAKKQLILLDAGLTLSAVILEQQINRLQTGNCRLQAVYLTHSHYDHLGSVPYLMKKFPGLQTGAHPVAQEVMHNPKAVKLMQALNEESEKKYAHLIRLPPEAKFRPFLIDRIFRDQEIIYPDDTISMQIIYMPGHSRDSIAFYILPDKVLYCSDGIGVPTPTGFIQATFLSNYDDYLASLYKLQKLDIDILALPHTGVIKGRTDIQTHFAGSIDETVALRERIARYLTEFDGEVEKVTRRIAEEDIEKHQIIQPREAFIINLKAMVVKTKRDIETGLL
ncbi:MAG TPA: MBL fold metallo-hydrolase [Bacteroidetes bacterium]|nr:MBL fold metallo-hydrolase [Bacteroidota bacterium]